MHASRAALAALVLLVASIPALAQTTAGSGTVIVVPVTAETASFTSEITVYNPNGVAVTVDVAFYEANNLPSPGLKPCTDAVVPANRSVQFSLAAQCTLGAGSHFGVLVLSDVAGTHPIYGYARTQNPQGLGFSIEGFPAENFNNQVSHATGLKRTTGVLIYQTNCFVGSLASPVNYTLKLFNDTNNAQIGSTITGSLGAFQQMRYLDVFSAPPNGVGAPAGNQLNVRAEFESTNNALLVGFCTVQDNTSFGADFRIAKSYGTPPLAFVNGGNTFGGSSAALGTTVNTELSIIVNGGAAMRYEPSGVSPRLIGGHGGNFAGGEGATVGGGGKIGFTCYNPTTETNVRICQNSSVGDFATVAGGLANVAAGIDSFVGGGASNTASGTESVVGGGFANIASGPESTLGGGSNNSATGPGTAVGGGFKNSATNTFSTVGGGFFNQAKGQESTIGGGQNNLATTQDATIAGGFANQALGLGATVGGGRENGASGPYSTVPGGTNNLAAGFASFAAGDHAFADQNGCFVFSSWSTSHAGSCDVPYFARFLVDHGLQVDYSQPTLSGAGTRYVYIGDVLAGRTISTWTTAYLSDSGVWTNASDRELKDGFAEIDAGAMLEAVVHMPVKRWHYRHDGPSVVHVGPTAQDFKAAFGLGYDDKSIGTVDADGVALVAIQGLNAKLEAKVAEQTQELNRQRNEIAELRQAVEQLLAQRDLTQRLAGR